LSRRAVEDRSQRLYPPVPARKRVYAIAAMVVIALMGRS
jgi:hypothetical protein